MFRFSDKKRAVGFSAIPPLCTRGWYAGFLSEKRLKCLVVLMLGCLLLTGCQNQSTPVEETIPEPTTTAFYDPGSPMELRYSGAVRTYPLPMAHVLGIRALGNDLLVFSGPTRTSLTLLSGDQLTVKTTLQLDHFLAPEDPSLHITDGRLSFFDPHLRETVVLSWELEETNRIAAPQDMIGSPILSGDGKLLFYCTPQAIRAWDLTTGIRRMLKETSFPSQNLVGLHLKDSVLECTVTDSSGSLRTMLLNPSDGQLLYEREGQISLDSGERFCYAALPAGMTQLLLFGEDPASPQALTTAELNDGTCRFLTEHHSAVIIQPRAGGDTELNCYDLSTGLRTGSLTLGRQVPTGVEASADGWVYILVYDKSYGRQVLYRWDVSALPTGDREVYTTAYTPGSPDPEGLQECLAYAQSIGSRYGIEVLIQEDALRAAPWDYAFLQEDFVPFLRRELELLDRALSNFPQSVLDDTRSHFSALQICLVRQITGTPESGSLESVNGIQFFGDGDASLALAVGPRSDQVLYHELFHVMETHLLGRSTAFDQWDSLNPPGFSYDYSYLDGTPRNPALYTQGTERAFVDAYSISFPKEDRARIMEHAMIPGNEALFQSPILQAKLKTLCAGIRQAYNLKKSPEAFLWEQYLDAPLAHGVK